MEVFRKTKSSGNLFFMDPGIIMHCTVVYGPVYKGATLEKHILKGNGPFNVP